MSSDNGTGAVLAFGGLILALVVAGMAITYRHTTPSTVTAVSWAREIRIDAWLTVRKGDWSVPERGHVVGSERKVRSYKKVWSGSHSESYSCSTTREPSKRCSRRVDDYTSVPVWDTYYTYDIDEWTYEKSLLRRGSDHNPVWADATDLRTSADPNAPRIGDEREESRNEHYWIFVPDQFELSYTQWQDYDVEQRVNVTRNMLDVITDVQKPEGN